MIDIHCHLLYGVDDGAAALDMSERMLSDAAGQGITDMILTPHYRRGMFSWNRKKIAQNFMSLREAAAYFGIGIFLGCEYHADADMVQNLRQGNVPTLAGSDHVLTEFGYESDYVRMRNTLDDLLSNGYVPVIAHAERYHVIQKDVGILAQLREMGCLIQMNAGGILGVEGHVESRTCKTALKEDVIDIVASDSHDMSDRRSRMRQCRDLVAKKYGEQRARRLFEENAGEKIFKRTDVPGLM